MLSRFRRSPGSPLKSHRVSVEPVVPSRAQLLRRLTLIALLALGCLLLFLGRQPEGTSQWLRELWNFGHVALFAGLTWALLQRWHAALRWQLPLLLVATALLGYLVELVQRQIGRDFSLRDVLLDVIGSALGLFVATRRRLTRSQQWLVGLPLLAILGALVVPFALVVWDTVQAQRQFPRLATFESPLELRRFQLYGGTHGEIRDGALQLELGTDEWSGFTLFEPPADWRGFGRLVLAFDNPGSAPVELTCRIHDRQHRTHRFDIHDRFNRRFLLAPGSHVLRISLSDVEQAPRTRAMAMARIDALGCFVHRQSASHVLQLRRLFLQ